jgi:guanyl-specific ribonuclease Sa
MLERRIQDLPAEAKDVLQKINLSFRFPNIKDGSIYRNRERILPEVTICEYYIEYTVPTPNQVVGVCAD